MPYHLLPVDKVGILTEILLKILQSGAAEVLKYAFKVDFWDVDAMADDIYALLHYPALSAFSAKAGYDEVNALKWNAATAKLKAVYESVLK